jgi:phosphopantetheinyl transferase
MTALMPLSIVTRLPWQASQTPWPLAELTGILHWQCQLQRHNNDSATTILLSMIPTEPQQQSHLLQRYRAMLSQREQQRLDGFKRPLPQLAFLLGRVLIRQLLAKQLGRAPADIAIALSRNGKPYVVGTDWHISISHSQQVVAVVLAPYPMGMDLEQHVNLVKLLPQADVYLNPMAAQDIWQAEQPLDQLACYWTALESSVKLLDSSLFPLRQQIRLSRRFDAGRHHPPLLLTDFSFTPPWQAPPKWQRCQQFSWRSAFSCSSPTSLDVAAFDRSTPTDRQLLPTELHYISAALADTLRLTCCVTTIDATSDAHCQNSEAKLHINGG